MSIRNHQQHILVMPKLSDLQVEVEMVGKE